VVLADPGPFVPLTIPSRTRRKESDYGAKAVMLDGRRAWQARCRGRRSQACRLQALPPIVRQA
jgi:hypothetical protein